MRLPRSVSVAVLAGVLALGCEALPEPGLFEDGPPLGDGKADGWMEDVPAYHALPAAADLEGSFEVLFAPDEPVATVELEMIARVREARAQDAAAYEEGDNPYRIRYAVYNLRNPRIAAALANAADDGVDVQVLIEADQLDPAREYNTMDEYLVRRGFELAPSHRDLDAAGRRSADLIGIVGYGLMHLKTRLFETPTWRAVLSGSLNPGDQAVLNDENLQLLREPRLVEAYARAYDAVLADERLPNTWDDDAAVNVLFTPAAGAPRAGTRILEWIASEDEQILLMIYALRDVTAAGVEGSLVDLLSAKAEAGVPVYVITDRKQSDGVDVDGNPVYRNDGTEDRLREAGVHVYEATNAATAFTAMHHKTAVLGRSRIRVITDAGNWSYSGLGSSTRIARNQESVLFIDTDLLDGGRTGRRYLGQWMRVLERYAHQSAPDGEPAFEAAAATLSGLSGWPAEPASFVAHDAYTEWGESLWVRGSLPGLGAWGEDHGGHLLVTDEAGYPRWWSEAPVDLPVGVRFDWKLAAGRSGAEARWEAGADRTGFVMAPPLTSGPALFDATWR